MSILREMYPTRAALWAGLRDPYSSLSELDPEAILHSRLRAFPRASNLVITLNRQAFDQGNSGQCTQSQKFLLPGGSGSNPIWISDDESEGGNYNETANRGVEKEDRRLARSAVG